MINTRSETITEKPSFREAFKKRKCIIPASGFYEWQTAAGGKGVKQPFYFYLKTKIIPRTINALPFKISEIPVVVIKLLIGIIGVVILQRSVNTMLANRRVCFARLAYKV